MAEDPNNPRHLPVHSFKSAELNGESVIEPKGFNIDKFIEDQNIGFLLSNKPVKLEAIFEPLAGYHLTETPISKNQELTLLPNGNYKLKALLPDTPQLKWWLLGF